MPLLRELRQIYPALSHIFADRIYRGQQLRDALADRLGVGVAPDATETNVDLARPPGSFRRRGYTGRQAPG